MLKRQIRPLDAEPADDTPPSPMSTDMPAFCGSPRPDPAVGAYYAGGIARLMFIGAMAKQGIGAERAAGMLPPIDESSNPMRRLSLGLVALTLAACSPVYVPAPVAPLERPISPQEAAAIVIDATNTAAAVATQDAHATATGQSARETATAGRQATQDSLEGLQTQGALQLTQSAGLAMSTDISAAKTQAAQQTAAWSTPTAAALAAQVRGSATASARQDARAIDDFQREQAIASARGWLLLAIGILFLIGLAAAVVFGTSDLLSARAELLRAAAARANAESRQLWIMQYAGFLLQLREGGWEVMHAPALGGPVIDAIVPGLGQVREVPVRAKGEVVSALPVGERETPEREHVLHLLGQAIAIAGSSASFIPSAERLGLHPQDWQLAVDKLKAGPDRPAYVMTRAGRPKAGQAGGTRLCQPAYMTLGALRDGVKRGDVLPRPVESAIMAAPGNIQSAHFEAS